MPIEVTMPKLSPTMESGVVSQWLVKVGDTVKEGDPLADIETDKATMPMTAFDDGVVAVLDHAIGDEVKIGERVLVLAKKGEDPKQVAAQLGGGAKAAPAQAAAPTPAKSSPEATNAPQHPESSNGQEGHGRAAEAETETEAAAPASTGGRVKSSPLARKIAAAEKVDLGRVSGSGPGGRIIRRDVDAHLKSRAESPTPVSKTAAPAAAPKRSLAAERIPHTRMRKTIAQRMTEAKAVAPEIHVTVDARVDALAAARERLNAKLAPEKIKLSLGDFVTKAVALALRQHPGVNASYEADAIVRHGDVNIGIAVALDGGLIVPVLKNADTLGLREIRTGSEALAQSARANKLSTDQMGGGTFTISNLGMYGVRQFDAIINLPEVAILAVGAAEKRPVVVGDALAVGTVMTLTLTADHRAVDGAMAAEFLRTLKGFLEEPTAMLL